MEIPRRVVRGGLAITALGTFANLIGCGIKPYPNETPRTPIVIPAEKKVPPIGPTVTVIESGESDQLPIVELATNHPEIDLYYPALKDYPVFSSGELTTDLTHTRWLNLSALDFNPALAKTTFEFFEDLAKKGKMVNYQIGARDIPLSPAPKPRKERVIFLVPQEPPKPWPNAAQNASTTGIFDGPYVTFVRVNDERNLRPSLMFTSIALAANRLFAVETCQSSITIYSLSPEIANLGQEIFCNSYGSAFTIKQMEIPYERYYSWAREVLIRQDPQSPYFPLYVLSEQEYGQIPVIEFAIGKNQLSL